MAVASENSAKIEPSQSMDSSPSRRVSDATSDTFSGGLSSLADPPSPSRELGLPPQPSLRSEEYRQLFRLPPDEVLVQDFNCALQENFLLQGHMYLFVHFICFYSNLFGFETKKIIPFHDITSVRRAKAAGIFPTAIEIMAGEKKYFFTSFLSRDEAFKLISDGWLQHGNGAKAITDQQDSKSEVSNEESGTDVHEKAKGSVDELDSVGRSKDVPSSDLELPPNGESEIVVSTVSSGVPNNIQDDSETVLNNEASSSGKTLNIEASSSKKSLDIEASSSGKTINSEALSSEKTLAWEQENADAPEVPAQYTKVAESKFPIKVEDFFSLCFSDEAVGFLESYHTRCGDKDFKCTPWYKHDEFGHARDLSFEHPIKAFLGARFGSCQEIQKFRVYRSSHLVIETSQEVSGVPYADYFRVEGLWDVESDGDESKDCCILRVYLNVAFSKKTMLKGRIVQSTLDESRDAYAIWIDLAHELMKQKNLEKQEAGSQAALLIPNGQVHLERPDEAEEPSQRPGDTNDTRISQLLPESNNVSQQVGGPVLGNLTRTTSVPSVFRESMMKFYLSLKSQGHIPLLLMITFSLILILMQLSIVVLLARPHQVQVISPTECMRGMHTLGGERGLETMAWLEKRVHHLKDEMHMVETLLEKMRVEHSLLKAQLIDLEHLTNQQQ